MGFTEFHSSKDIFKLWGVQEMVWKTSSKSDCKWVEHQTNKCRKRGSGVEWRGEAFAYSLIASDFKTVFAKMS